jgi:hypothetical protein
MDAHSTDQCNETQISQRMIGNKEMILISVGIASQRAGNKKQKPV